MAKEIEKKKHGGARVGAGRKTIGLEPKKTLPVRVNVETIKKVRELALESGKSQAYIVELAVRELSKVT
jgi:hypothetical protein